MLHKHNQHPYTENEIIQGKLSKAFSYDLPHFFSEAPKCISNPIYIRTFLSRSPKDYIYILFCVHAVSKRRRCAALAMIVWLFTSTIVHIQQVPITTKVVNSILAHVEVYSIYLYWKRIEHVQNEDINKICHWRKTETHQLIDKLHVMVDKIRSAYM